MLDKVALWQRVEPLVTGLGFGLFDMDLPGRQGGVLRVYISARAAATREEEGTSEESELLREGSVSVDDCAEVSRAILRAPDVEEILPGNTLLEVSSPGVNRRLSLRDHFEGAVAERVKVTFESPESGTRTVRGVLEAVTATASSKGEALQPESVAQPEGVAANDASGIYRRLYGSRAGWQVVVKVAESGEQVVVPGDKIARARVDFDFSSVREPRES